MRRKLLILFLSICLSTTIIPIIAYSETNIDQDTCEHSYNLTLCPATLDSDGYEGYVCEYCGDIKDKTIIYHPQIFKLSQNEYTFSIDATTMKPSPRRPKVTIYDTQGNVISDLNYTVSYKNNVNAGIAKAVITFDNLYSGKKTIEFKIKPQKITSAHQYRDYCYNGKIQKIDGLWCTVTDYDLDNLQLSYHLVAGKDFDLSFDRTFKKIGAYKATVKFKGNYTGIRRPTIKMIPSEPKVKVVSHSKTRVKLEWKKVKGAQGYKIYRQGIDSTGISKKLYKKTTGTKCWVNKPKNSDSVIITVVAYKKVGTKTYKNSNYVDEGFKPAKAVLSAKHVKSGIKLTVDKPGNYEIKASSVSDFRDQYTVSFLRNIQGSYTIKNYTSGRKYYFKVRKYAYSSYYGKTLYGKWSDSKSAKA